MDFLVTTWILFEDLEGKDVYYRLVVFYFIFDQSALKDLQSPHRASLSPQAPFLAFQTGS